ncbi:hypothetical protein ACC862_38175, partial [Rhizobium ruizarguesonis]
STILPPYRLMASRPDILDRNGEVLATDLLVLHRIFDETAADDGVDTHETKDQKADAAFRLP